MTYNTLRVLYDKNYKMRLWLPPSGCQQQKKFIKMEVKIQYNENQHLANNALLRSYYDITVNQRSLWERVLLN